MSLARMLVFAVAAGLAAVSSAVVPLPEEYKFCDYVKADAKQWIDTGVEAQANLRVETKVKMTKVTTGATCLLVSGKGDASSASKGRVGLAAIDANGNFRVMRGTKYGSLKTRNINAVDVNCSSFLPATGDARIALDGVEGSVSIADTLTDSCLGQTFYLFAENRLGEPAAHIACTLYSMQIYANATGLADGTMIRDFIPCQDANGVYGLWDKVNGVFYKSQSGTALGGKVSDPQPEHEEPGEEPEEPIVEPIDTGATENWPDAVTAKIEVNGSTGGDLGTIAVHGEALAAYLAKTDYMDHAATGSTSQERPKPIAVTVGETILYYDNLLLGEKKNFTVGSISGSFTVDATPPRMIAVPVNAEATTFVANVRDLGGWPLVGGGTTKQGSFFRGGRLDDFVAANPGADNFLASVLGIKTEIDLRKANEGSHAAPEGITHLDVPFNGATDSVPYGLGGTYNQEQIRTVFSTLGTDGKLPAYFHCSIGRDRTGMIAQLLLQLAGVSTENIYRDYFTSLFANVEGASDNVKAGTRIQERIDWLQNGGDTTAPVTGEKYGDTLAGRTREYLEAIGVTSTELGRITAALTGETPDQIIARVKAASEDPGTGGGDDPGTGGDEPGVNPGDEPYTPTGTPSSGAFTWTGASSTTTYWEDCDNWDLSGKYPNKNATVVVPAGTWQMSAAFDYSSSAPAAKQMQFSTESKTIFSGGRQLFVSGTVNGLSKADNFFSDQNGEGFLLESSGTNTSLTLQNTGTSCSCRIRYCSDGMLRASNGGSLTIDNAYFGGGSADKDCILGLVMAAVNEGSVLTFAHDPYDKGLRGTDLVFLAQDGGKLVFKISDKTNNSGYGFEFAAGASPSAGLVVSNGLMVCQTTLKIGVNADLGQFVTVQGANPSLTSTGDITLGGGSGGLALTLKPEATWSATVPRIKADGKLTVGSTATFTIDLANLTLAPGTTATIALAGGATLVQSAQPVFAAAGAYKCGTTTEGNVLYLAVTNDAAKVLVNPPVIASKSYTGEAQTADVAESAQYTVVENAGGTDAGTYPVVLRLADPEATAWNDEGETTGDKTLDFVITKAANAWTLAPTMSKLGWREGETAGMVSATPAFGEATVTYDDGADEMPTAAGNHMAHVSVTEAANYAGLADVAIPFTIFPVTSPSGTEVPALDADSNLIVTDATRVFDAGGLTVGTAREATSFVAAQTGGTPEQGIADGGHCVWIKNSDVTLLNGAYTFNEMEVLTDGAALTVGDGATLNLVGKGTKTDAYSYVHACQNAADAIRLNVVAGGAVNVTADHLWYVASSAQHKTVNVDGGTMAIRYSCNKNDGNAVACGFGSLVLANGGSFSCEGYYVTGGHVLNISDTAKFTTTGTLTASGTATIALTVPSEGLAEAMITAKTVNVSAKALKVDLSAMRWGTHRIPLITATNALTVDFSEATVVKPSKATEVTFETEGNTLYANVKTPGLLLLIL